MGFTWFDFAAVIVLLLSGVMAFARGLIREVFSIIAFIGGAIAAVFFASMGQPLVSQFTPLQGPLASVAAGLVIFLVVFITITVITSVVAKEAHQSTEISSFDRAAGLAFGILRGVVVVSLFVLLMRQGMPAAAAPSDPAQCRAAYDSVQADIRCARTYPIYGSVATALETILPQASSRVRDIYNEQKGESAPIPPANPPATTAPSPGATP
jgi:membrane protein required for colicin V production